MKQGYFILSSAIAMALASSSGLLVAQTLPSSNALAGINTTEAPRVTQTINNNVRSTLGGTHLGLANKLKPTSVVADSTVMQHLQLVLQPSAKRANALQSLIAEQHDPRSARFHQWVTPAQFGAAFGVADSDIAAAKSWLVSQGFTVNGVYPNKLQIDFSGTARQVNLAFHTQESVYKLNNGTTHIANAADISVPSALKDVVKGVVGLNDFHPMPLNHKPQIAKFNSAKQNFNIQYPAGTKTLAQALASSKTAASGQAVPFNNGATRGLVPYDVSTMYGVLPLRANQVNGAHITIAVVEDGDMVPADWTNFVGQFNLGSYGGTFTQTQPQATGFTNCTDPGDATADGESIETLLDAEYSTAIAPGANIMVASCSDSDGSNFFGGVFVAADNLINGATLPDIISASYGYGEFFTDPASKTAIDAMWAQADAEGISVFVATGDSGSNPSFNGGIINGYYHNTAIDANSFATSPNDTAVGGTDTADVLDGDSSKYFSSTMNAVYGTALSYVPEIPWNSSCGNSLAAEAYHFPSAVAFCQFLASYDTNGYYFTSEGGSGGPSSVDAKPTWQSSVFGAANDTSRDLPDVSLFAGSYGDATWVILCTANYPCTPNFTGPVILEGGTSLATPMFAGIQALIDQGLVKSHQGKDQGNAAPTLYGMAKLEYGAPTGPSPSSLATCNSDNGATGTANCVFHNVTRSNNSTQCYQETVPNEVSFTTPNCYFYGSIEGGDVQIGLTSQEATPTDYTVASKAYSAQPGWSFASGLGSVNATNLLIEWRAFITTP